MSKPLLILALAVVWVVLMAVGVGVITSIQLAFNSFLAAQLARLASVIWGALITLVCLILYARWDL